MCRKPKSGLLLQAEERYSLQFDQTVFIGDSTKDIQCALQAGCGQTILVQTGNGLDANKQLQKLNINCDFFAKNLLDAVRWLKIQSE